MFDGVERRIDAIQLPGWGRVSRSEGVVGWLVFDDAGTPVPPIREFLIDFVAQDNSTGSVRSYAYDLLRCWRWLRAVGVEWDEATPAEGRDLVLWLMRARKQRIDARTKSLATVGTVNPITRKRYLDDRYAVRTIRHSNAVVRAFYQYWIVPTDPAPVARHRARVGGPRTAAHGSAERRGDAAKPTETPRDPRTAILPPQFSVIQSTTPSPL